MTHTFEDSLANGKSAFHNKEYLEAILIFKHLISDGFENLEVYHLLGYSYLYTQQHSEAEIVFQRLHQNYQDSLLGLCGLANLKIHQNQVNECLDIITPAMEKNPKHLGLIHIYIHALFKKKIYSLVIEWSDKAIEIHNQRNIPLPAIVLHCHGKSLESTGNHQKASNIFDQLLLQYPDHHLGYIDHAQYYENKRLYHLSLQAWKRAYDLFPKNKEIIIWYTSLLNRFGFLRESTNILNGNSFVTQQNFELCKRLIYNNILLKQWQELIDFIQSVIEGKANKNPTGICDYLFQKLMENQGLSHFKDHWVDHKKGTDKALYAYINASIHYCEGQFAKALESIEQYFSTENGIENDINALQRYYNILLQLEDVHAADQIYDAYLKDKNIHYKLFYDRALQYKRRLLPEPSVSNIEKAFELAPDNPGVIHNQFLIYYRFNGTKKALDFLQNQSHKTQALLGKTLQELIPHNGFSDALKRMESEEKNSNLSWNILLDIYNRCIAQGGFSHAVTLLSTFNKKPLLTFEDFVLKVNLFREARHLKSLLHDKMWVQFAQSSFFKGERSDLLRILKQILKIDEKLLTKKCINPIPYLQHIIEDKLSSEFIQEYFQGYKVLSTKCNRFYPDTYTNVKSAFQMAELLRNKIKNKIPTQLISIDYADGIFLELMSNDNSEFDHFIFDAKGTQKVTPNPEPLEDLTMMFDQYMYSLEAADILGLPDWNSVLKAIMEFKKESAFNEYSGLLNIYRNLNTQFEKVRLDKFDIVTHSDLISDFNYFQLLPYIFDSVEKCYVISSKPEIIDHLKINLKIPIVEWIEVPENFLSPKKQFEIENKAFHNDILEKIEYITSKNKGALFLVSAGIRSKIYGRKIKESGSISLEIGSLSEFWSGQEKKYGYEHPVPPLGVTFTYPHGSDLKINFDALRSRLWNKLIRKPEKEIIIKVYFFMKFNSIAFTLFKDDKSLSDWEYKTFFLAYNCPMPGTIEYHVVSSPNTYHRIQPAHYKSEQRIWLKFYAYPEKNAESHIQKFRIPFIASENIQSVTEILQTPFYPVCEMTHLNGITHYKNSAFNYHNIKPAISIVMAYKNRKTQIAFTLSTIEKSQFPKDQIEVIIADDGSHESQCVLDIIESYAFPIVIMKIADRYKMEKNYINSCIPYNKAFKMARGESVIIQNPEVCHVGDVLLYVNQHLNENEYLSFTCAQLYKSSFNEVVQKLYYKDNDLKDQRVREFIEQQSDKLNNSFLLWYNHPIFRAASFHFLCAIHKNNLKNLEGFREEYAFGHGVDDVEFIYRIRNRLQLKVRYTDWKSEPFGIHQWHPSTAPPNKAHQFLISRNNRLFSSLNSQKSIVRQSFSMKSEEHKLVIYSYPFNGITTIRSWFLVLLGKYTFDDVLKINPHTHNWLAYEDDHPSSTTDYEKILVFRNPVERFISMYKNLLAAEFRDHHFFKKNDLKTVSMARLIDILYDEMQTGNHKFLLDPRISPQFKSRPYITFTKIFTTDQIPQFLEYANQKYKVNFPMSTKMNKSNVLKKSRDIELIKKLPPDTLEKFSQLYNIDIEFYNSQFLN